MRCSVQLTLRDSNRNVVAQQGLFTNIDIDTTLKGPFSIFHPAETLYIPSVDNTYSALGLYYFEFSRIYTGIYFLYIRIRDEQAPIDK